VFFRTTTVCILTSLLISKNYEVSLGCAVLKFEPRKYLEVNMKKLVLAAALTGAASTAFAGNLSEPVVEAPVIIEETTGSSSGIMLPLLLLVLVAAAVAAGD